MSKLLVAIKSLLARFTTIIEFCHDCGVKQPLVWHADNELWALVTDQPVDNDMGGVLCPKCFDRRTRALGVHLYWVPNVEWVVADGI